jgi:hypothetical protein
VTLSRISRRAWLQGLAAGAASWPLLRSTRADAQSGGELLYNGIRLGKPWPPALRYPDEHAVEPPYLAQRPAIVPIDVGRQLFVDDFLIEETTLTRRCHQAAYHSASPVLRPETPWEQRDDASERTKVPTNPAAMVFSDGVFYDHKDRIFKMWYMAGYGSATCMATSTDGVKWDRPSFDVVKGTNIVSTSFRDSSTVWLDERAADPREKYKMSIWYDRAVLVFVSPDGIHWTETGKTGRIDDRSTFFYNPFRNVWVFSLRDNQYPLSTSGRYRRYWESPVFMAAPDWAGHAPVAWVKADSSDMPRRELADHAELYNLDCIGYESLMLGLFTVWRGEPRDREKINEIAVGFSRDGFHWSRPDRGAFMPVSDREGSWNWANVQSAGGGCVIDGDRLLFYCSGRQGRPGSNAPGVCTTGLATLRRDGFVSMDWMPEEARVVRITGAMPQHGTLTTRPVRFSGGHCFVNADLAGGELRVEVLDRAGNVVKGFERASCAAVSGDGTRLRVSWKDADLRVLAGQPVRFRFSLTRGRLYAFWVSPWPTGESRGYPAAGGPEFNGPLDARPA